ncbi:hypothetical protein P3T37_005189 [Kitasatospora sp. MAA4]|nr:hypothetical protein [Kitasatospora sp. MAA4]
MPLPARSPPCDRTRASVRVGGAAAATGSHPLGCPVVDRDMDAFDELWNRATTPRDAAPADPAQPLPTAPPPGRPDRSGTPEWITAAAAAAEAAERRRRRLLWGVPAVLGLAALAATLTTCGPGGTGARTATLVRADASALPAPALAASAWAVVPWASGAGRDPLLPVLPPPSAPAAAATPPAAAAAPAAPAPASASAAPETSASSSSSSDVTADDDGGTDDPPSPSRSAHPVSPRHHPSAAAPPAGGQSASTGEAPAPAAGAAGEGLCATAEQYGQWSAGSAQEQLCREVYGR